MADKKKPPVKSQTPTQAKNNTANSTEKPRKKSNIIKLVLLSLGLVILLGTGFAAGVYLNFIDINQLAQTYKLYDYPLFSRYFAKPQTNFETVPVEPEQPSNQLNNPVVPSAPPTTAPTSVPEKRETDKFELEKQLKTRQLEEDKKISKLARLYGNMKPDEAVLIMNQLEDEIILAIFSRMEEEQVAKIMALFDPKKSARLTQEMIKIKPVLPSANSL